MRTRHRLRLAGALLAAALALAPSGAAAGGPLDFELAHLDGGFVRLEALPAQPTVVNFWRSDCPPCVRELPLLQDFARGHAGVTVIAVAMQPRAMTEERPVAEHERFMVLVGPREPEGLLRRFGARSTAIPYTAVLRADRTLCARRTGEVTREWLEAALAACGRPA
jgi:thiol-disulfide isomerase/thioredoxin